MHPIELANKLDELLKTDPNSDTLKGWYECLIKGICEEKNIQGNYKIAAARQKLMKEMSNRLPKKEISFCRVKPSTEPDKEKVQKMMQDPCFKEYPPIVVHGNLSTGPLELADGKHRITAAKRLNLKTIWAVQASEKTIQEICEGVSKGENVLEQ